jgi:glycosyltransferase involved in cell wall biosynthesis
VRILHTAATYAPSLDGVAEIVRNISERLVRRGHDVHVATAAIDSEAFRAQLNGVHVHRFKVRGNLALGMNGETQRYLEFVCSGHWDILVNHSLHVWPTDLLLKDIGSYSWPSVLVTQGLVNEDPLHWEYYSTIPRYLPAYFKWIRVSHSTAELSFAKKFNIPIPPVITNGVDMDEWSRPPLGLRQSWRIGPRPWVVNVSNHSPVKNHKLFFQLAKSLPNLGAHFTLIAGTYPMNKWGLGRFGISGGCAYQCRLRSTLSPDAVHLRVNLRREEVVSAIKEANVVVSTSGKEANSIVLLESMAAGIPWVSFDVGSARENEGGIVAANFSQMVEAVIELSQNPRLRERLGAAGRAQVVVKHDWDIIVDQYEQLYELALGSKTLVMSPA